MSMKMKWYIGGCFGVRKEAIHVGNFQGKEMNEVWAMAKLLEPRLCSLGDQNGDLVAPLRNLVG